MAIARAGRWHLGLCVSGHESSSVKQDTYLGDVSSYVASTLSLSLLNISFSVHFFFLLTSTFLLATENLNDVPVPGQ